MTCTPPSGAALHASNRAGAISAPGAHAALYADLPRDIAGLVRVIQGLVVHVFWRHRYGLAPDASRLAELQLRSAEELLGRILELDAQPLALARPPERRLTGVCRDFTLLLVSMLRERGVHARARVGFARYFGARHHEDHWVCEYRRDGDGRWTLVDPQLDALQRGLLGIAFDPLDVPRDAFLTAGEAWRRCRAGEADPATFGIGDHTGLFMVAGNVVRDVAALNAVELLPWDGWGLMRPPDAILAPGELAALDAMAALTAGDVPAIAEVVTAYRSDDAWRVPAIIGSFTGGGITPVELPASWLPAPAQSYS